MIDNPVGTLYVMGTPIGNLEDMTFRALRILKEVDLIAAEDTRHSIKLLNHFDIHTKMVAYHKFNEYHQRDKCCELLKSGKSIALISDAGMPVISDPGYLLVAKCQEEGIPVRVLPGANAALCGIILSGIDCSHFTFMGFIGKSNKELKAGIEAVVVSSCPTVIYESPHRLTKLLELLATRIPHRKMTISREITKQHEETLFGTVSELLVHFENNPPKGEFVLVITGRTEDGCLENDEMDPMDALKTGEMKAHYDFYVEQGLSEKEAMKAVAKDRGISKRDVYGVVKIREQ